MSSLKVDYKLKKKTSFYLVKSEDLDRKFSRLELMNLKKDQLVLVKFNPFDDRLTPYELKVKVSSLTPDGIEFKFNNNLTHLNFISFDKLGEGYNTVGTYTFWRTQNE